MIKKLNFTTFLLFFLISFSTYGTSLDFSTVLGFSGMYKENSWTPLIVRISNNEQSVNGLLVIETSNSSTAIDQIRQYVKPVDLPSGSTKEFSFVIPIGHHSKDIRIMFKTDGSTFFEDTIELKQKGVKQNFILGVSPYPDLGFLYLHEKLGSRSISYPHIDNLPDNSNGYDSVDIISMHRELMDKLTVNQYEAVTGWVSSGGIFIVWGGKTPSPSKWNILPSSIRGLKRVNSLETINNADSLLINIIDTPPENVILNENNHDLITFKKSGSGMVFFVSFDYSGVLKDWNGISRIWDLIFNYSGDEVYSPQRMENNYSIEKFISIFDNSTFSHIARKDVALILVLSASASASILIFIRFRRKSKNLSIYISGMIVFLSLLSLIIFLSLFNSNFRTDSSIIAINTIKQTNNSEKSLLYKDILIGSSNETTSDVIIRDDIESVLYQDNYERLEIYNLPELQLKDIEMKQWTSKTLQLKSSIDSLFFYELNENRINIRNNSDYYIQDSFLLYKGVIQSTGNIMPVSNTEIELLILNSKSREDEEIIFHSNTFLNNISKEYIEIEKNDEFLYFCGFISEEIHPIEFTEQSWKKKTANLIIMKVTVKEDENEKPSF